MVQLLFSSLAVSHRLYAVAGSNGQVEENSVEMFDSSTGKWKYVASLPVRLSNIGKLTAVFVHKIAISFGTHLKKLTRTDHGFSLRSFIKYPHESCTNRYRQSIPPLYLSRHRFD